MMGRGIIKTWEQGERSGSAQVGIAITRAVALAEALEGITDKDIRQFVADNSTTMCAQPHSATSTDKQLKASARMNRSIAADTRRDIAVFKRSLDVLQNMEFAGSLKAIAAAQAKVIKMLDAQAKELEDAADKATKELERRSQERARKANPGADIDELNNRISELEALIEEVKRRQ